MITNRKKTRKLLYQILFNKCFQKVDLENFYTFFYKDIFSFKKDDEYINSMLKILEYYESFFVNIIKKYSPKFDFKNMNIENIIPIYIALSEIFYLKEEIPIKVSINEAIELAKIYSNDSSKKIVNGILNNVMKDYDKLSKDKEKITNEEKYSIFKT